VGETFWDYTPAEFTAIAHGYLRRERREWIRVAWLACQVLSPFTERALNPVEVLPEFMRHDFPHRVIED
jgi:hypothetical protein